MKGVETAQRYWDSQGAVPPQMLGVHGMGGGGLAEVLYRHYFESKHLRRVIPFEKTTRVLELGCGNGRWALALGPRVAQYVGVDFSKCALDRARSEIARMRLDNVVLHEVPILDFHPVGQFDVIYFSGVSQYLEDADLLQILRNLSQSILDSTILVDRSTINDERREVIHTPDYYSIFRTPGELETLYASGGFRLLYRKRSYRFLRLTRPLNNPWAGAAAAWLVSLFQPLSYYLMWSYSLCADLLHPIPFEGGHRSHDFLIFRKNLDT